MSTQHFQAFQLLEKASNTLNRRIALELVQWDLSVIQFQTLDFIASRDACIPSHCAHALSISTSGITRVLDQLEGRSLLTRDRVGHDRRLVYLNLTPSGRQIVQEANAGLSERCMDIATRFPVAELSALNSALKKLSKAMEAPARYPEAQEKAATPSLRALRAI